MKLKFLGTGGGRFVTGRQTRQTGGIILESEETRLHIDPGPGALVHTHKQMEKPTELDGIVVSHAHLDHSTDVAPLIEMIAEIAQKPGALFANESVLKGYSDMEKVVSDYHQSLCRTVEQLAHDTGFEFQDLKIESQEMFHGDPKTVGFKISDSEQTIGFWTDTEFSEELIDFYNGCDIMVIYCTASRTNSFPGHTAVDEVPKIVEDTDASTVILTHFGASFIDQDMDVEKEWLDEQLDQKVVFAEDNMQFPGNRSLMDF